MSSILALSITYYACWLGQVEPQGEKPPVVAQAAQANPNEEKLSPAERLIRLQRAVAADQKRLDELKARLDDPKSEFNLADEEFKLHDKKLADLKKEASKRKDPKEVAASEGEMKALQEQWKLSRDRFNLAIEERQTQLESVSALVKKLDRDRKALDLLMGAAPAPEATPASTIPAGQNGQLPTKTDPAKKDPPAPMLAPTVPAPVPANPTPVAAPENKNPDKPGGPTTDPGGISLVPLKPASTTPESEKPVAKPARPEIIKAHTDVVKKGVAAEQAKEKVRTVTDRIKDLSASIELEQKLGETAHKKATQAKQEIQQLEETLKRKRAENAPAGDLEKVRLGIAEVERRQEEAQNEIDASDTRLHDLRAELAVLQQEQIQAQNEAEKKGREAQAAEKTLAYLQNPFTPRNILQWLLDHGPKILGILLGTFLLHRLVRLTCARIVKLAAGSSQRSTIEEGENRAKTLIGVFRNSASLLILSGSALMLMDEMSIPIIPLLGGAAVLGLAVAFGAQNLIRDYFCGFMVLLEDQYGINDVIRIGEISGLVEKITLRITVLRDIEGIVHFIPHGAITTVSNLTHGWSKACFDIGIAYKEDADRVMTVLLDLGKELRCDSAFAGLILDDPEMLGVDGFGDSAVMIKFVIKTRPLKQWVVKREMLRRIKRRFDELGIEIPFPHRTLYHHQAGENQGREGGLTTHSVDADQAAA